MAQRYVSLPTAAKELGVHPHTLRRWVSQGKVQAIELPSGYRRFTIEQLDKIKMDLGILPKALAA